jgi:glyoxylase-like metal-dependent hydrolase (beta-lactamase superfamily II)
MADELYTIDLLKVGEADVRGPEVWWMSHWDSWERLVFYVVLVRGGGRTLLINTGIPDDLSVLNALWTQYNGDQRGAMRPAGNLLDALESRGVRSGDVTDIVLSPFQAYSVSNVDVFTKATIHISRTGWLEFHAPATPLPDHTQTRELAFPREILIYLVTDGWPHVRLLADEDEVIPGIKSFLAGVHHPESLALVIPTRSGLVTWTDGFMKLGNYQNAHPPGLTRSLDESARLQHKVERIGGIVLPAFDDTLLELYPEGRIG